MNAHARMLQQIDTAADAAQANADRVFVCSKVFGAPGGPRYTVLIDGDYYTVNHHLLIALKRGETPAELELDPEEIDEEML